MIQLNMGIKDFLTRKVIEHKMKDMPPQYRDMVTALLQDNPELFEKIGKEIEQKKKEGKSEQAAAMEVMRKYQGDIQKVMMSMKK